MFCLFNLFSHSLLTDLKLFVLSTVRFRFMPSSLQDRSCLKQDNSSSSSISQVIALLLLLLGVNNGQFSFSAELFRKQLVAYIYFLLIQTQKHHSSSTSREQYLVGLLCACLFFFQYSSLTHRQPFGLLLWVHTPACDASRNSRYLWCEPSHLVIIWSIAGLSS